MTDDEALHDKLEAYVRGKLPPGEAADLEREIAGDPALQDLVALHRLEQESYEHLLREDMQRKVRAWIEEPPPELPDKRFLQWKKWRWVLLLVALGVAGWFFFRLVAPEPAQAPAPSNPPTERPQAMQEPDGTITAPLPEKQSPDNDTPRRQLMALADEYHDRTFVRGSGLRSASGAPLRAGEAAYDSARYRAAIAEFQKNASQNASAREWLAHAYLKNGQFERAAAIFEQIARQDNVATVQERADWYLLLSLLPERDKQQTRINALFEKILADPEHEYFDAAMELKKKVDNMRF